MSEDSEVTESVSEGPNPRRNRRRRPRRQTSRERPSTATLDHPNVLDETLKVLIFINLVLSCPVPSCPVLSCAILSCPVLYCHVCPVLSYPVLSFHVLSCPCPVHSCLVLSCSVLSWLVLSCPVLSCVCPDLSYPILSCPDLSYPILSCPFHTYHVLSCRVLSSPVLSCPVLSLPVLSWPVLSCLYLDDSPVLSCLYLDSLFFQIKDSKKIILLKDYLFLFKSLLLHKIDYFIMKAKPFLRCWIVFLTHFLLNVNLGLYCMWLKLTLQSNHLTKEAFSKKFFTLGIQHALFMHRWQGNFLHNFHNTF